ncbi:hypothetical protein A3Q40_02201 [Rhodococcus sp. PBTS 1]|nr:hypothetical protein A3Q40_02201 [Rhodococcus sp. PBTS 1]MBY6438616.1 CopD family protein [Rhodococcus kroppenstedtii]
MRALSELLAHSTFAVVLGAAVVLSSRPSTDTPPRAWRLVAIASAGHTLACLVLLGVVAAEVAGHSADRVTLGDVVSVLHSLVPAQAALAGAVTGVVTTVIALDALGGGSGWSPWTVAGLAGVATAVSATGGHPGTGVAAIGAALHTVTAAVWVGSPLAAVITLRHAGEWSIFLRRFTRVAFWCAALTGVSGVALAAAFLTHPADIVTSDYGRLVAAKAAVFVLLLWAAHRLRRHWVAPAISPTTHVPPSVSRRRGVRHSLSLLCAVALAAWLAATPLPA